jgi:2-polyprenyl-6-hydroxyphenyl methylase/3-demethylubiquinone-9 3-methyltransferase
MSQLRDAEWRWKEGGGYYTHRVEDLAKPPLLPNLNKCRDRQLAAIFDVVLANSQSSRPHVLELGCGGSRWLPHLAVRGCDVAGIDMEPSAAALAEANLKGAGLSGRIICGDAFDPDEQLIGQFDLVYSNGLVEHFNDVVTLFRRVRRYLRPAGQIVTTVPNFQGINWWLQRLGDRAILETHVVYSSALLRRCHEQAGFRTRYSGYLGFYDGFISEAGPDAQGVRASIYRWACRSSNLAAAALTRATRNRWLPELWCLAPVVYYVGNSDESQSFV